MRNVGLDLVRFVAVSLVLLCHLRDTPLLPPSWLKVLQSGGGIGVILFFVMSGFLVSSLIFAEHARTGAVNIRRFLARRAFKLFPPYWCLLAVVAVIAALRTSRSMSPGLWKEMTVRALLVQNYFPEYFNHTWTLAVEADFYLLLAGIAAALLASRAPKPFSPVPAICVAILLGCGFVRWAEAGRLGTDPQFWAPTHLQIAPLCFGVLLAYLVAFNRLDDRLGAVPTWFLVAGGSMLMVVPVWCENDLAHLAVPGSPFGHAMAYAGAGLLVLGARRLNVSKSTSIRFIASLGAMSYSTYLWHGLVNIAAWRVSGRLLVDTERLTYVGMYVLGAFAIGALMYRLIEEPAMAVRNRMFSSASGGGSGAGPASMCLLTGQNRGV